MMIKILIVSCDASKGGASGPMRPMATENIPRLMSSATREFCRLQKAAGGNKLRCVDAWFRSSRINGLHHCAAGSFVHSLSAHCFLVPPDPFDCVESVRGGEVRLLVGLDADQLRDGGAGRRVKRPLLFIELADAASAEALIERAISGLALTVAQLWPFLWDGEDFSDLRADALGRLSLPIRLRALKRRGIPLSPVWARAAISELIQDRSPRVRRASPDVEFTQLCNAISPNGLALATSLDAAAAPEAFVRAVEWMATTAGAAVMVLSRDLPPASPPYERILFGARVFAKPAGLRQPVADGAVHIHPKSSERDAAPLRPR
ncbi:hypothetical protein CH337_21860 [Rhodoblastus acidophilus]|nr:hypothetical protein CKO16_14220 [Rhodoblastus acidophilus]RAI16340.1 hypothetical protein CH337_21860 [Rhodoblastus acidophilus]